MINLDRYIRHGTVAGRGSDDWRTPVRIFNALNSRFKFTRDAAANKHNSLCENYWDDALEMEWKGEKSLFVNPPYSLVASFLELAQYPETTVFLVPFRPHTTFFLKQVWGSDYLHEMMVIHRGIKFLHPEGKESVRSPMPCCVLVYHNIKRERDFLITVNCADSLQTLQVVAGARPGAGMKHSSIVRDRVIQEYLRGDSVMTLVERHGVSRATIYRWIRHPC